MGPKRKKSVEQVRREERERKRIQREDTEFRRNEQARNTEAHRATRQNSAVREVEQARNTTAHRVTRQNPAIREVEQARNTEAHRATRQNPAVRELEQARNTSAHRATRQNPAVREVEQARNTTAHRVIRQNPAIREVEQARNTEAHRAIRQNPAIREVEQARETVAKQVKRDPNAKSYEDLQKEFRDKKNAAPSAVCSCCGQLGYEQSITKVTPISKASPTNLSLDLATKVYVFRQNPHRLCQTCYRAIRNGNVPRLALSNGFAFPDQPDVLKVLTPLEERLVALRIPFMNIRLVGTERQSTLRGCVVNIENDLDVVAHVLPRSFDETSVVQVKLMRRMRDKTPYMWEKVRPHIVYQAAKYLITTPAYIEQNVGLSNNWEKNDTGEEVDFIIDSGHDDLPNNNDGVNEDDEELPAEAMPNISPEQTIIFNDKHTLYTMPGVAIAPGEGRKPIPFYEDLRAEEISFPKIYCGHLRTYAEDIRVSYTDIVKSELRMYDRRACTVEHLLFAMNKSRIEKIHNALQICLRKTTGSQNLTAGEIRRPETLERLIQKDEGYSVFKNIRSSPPYWQQKTKDVMAMMRQYGKCTFFLTLSAAETKWPELAIMLKKILHNEDISETLAAELTYQEISEMIKNDPVTCMTHFDHRFRAFLTHLVMKKNGVFGPNEVTDYFTRMEFQMRGSPHIHGLYWLKDAPTYNEDDHESWKKCADFIDQFITCERTETGTMEKLIAYQLHNHSPTCYKNRKNKDRCRFGFPKPPMDRTLILQPLPKAVPAEEIKKAKANYLVIHEKLVQMTKNFRDVILFDDFLKSLQLSREEYLVAVRSSIKRVTPFLKRDTNAIFVNQYNSKILQEWEANIDIQFVTDAYACARYCVGYILKSESGVSKLLKAAADDARKGNLTVKEKLKQYSKVLITGNEMGAQEAAAFVLGYPNTQSTRDVVYVSTSPPEERVRMLKPQEELAQLEEGSTDIVSKGLLEHYVQRHNEMEEICLADFATWYEYEKSTQSDTPPQATTSRANQRFRLLDNSGRMRKRNQQKILRYRHYGKGDDTGNHWREMLMLFVPWRDESELNNETARQVAAAKIDLIKLNSKPYYYDTNVDEEDLAQMMDHANEDDEEEPDPVLENDMGFFDGSDEDQYLMSDLLRSRPSPQVENFRPPKLIDDASYKQIMRSLNDKQRRFVMTILHKLKTSANPFYYFLSGGAGVGKSRVITALIQSYLRYDDPSRSCSPEDICVLVSAPTGKAAFNVFGMTLHSTFRLPPTQSSGKAAPLSPSVLNSLRTKLQHVKLFLIDEVSMVSVRQLFDIDARLQQIFCCDMDFGGKPVIVVGHLRQLPPVMGSYAFLPPKHLTAAAEAVDNPLWTKFQFYELDEIMRQQGEDEFCKALNNMAEGKMDNDDITLIRSRKISEQNQPGHDAVWLFSTVKACKEHNSMVHSNLQTEGAMATAHDQVQGRGSAASKQNLLEYAKILDQQKSDGLPYETFLKVGGIYFVSTNIDVQDGLFNGATGILRQIDYTTTTNNQRIPKYAWMEFEHELIGLSARLTTKIYQQENGLPESWVRISRVKRNLSVVRGKGLEIIRRQIPLVAANGMTIHKSQGSSMHQVVVSVKGLRPTMNNYRELIYVACSRAISPNGLFVDGDFLPPLPPKQNDPVSKALMELNKRQLEFPFKFLQDFDSTFERLFYQNIHSIMGKISDVQTDQCAAAATILAFTEPWLKENDNILIDGFQLIHKSWSENHKNSKGLLLLCKDPEPQLPVYQTHQGNVAGSHCQFLTFEKSLIHTVLMYRHATYPLKEFLTRLENILRRYVDKRTVFIGDINTNLASQDGATIIALFKSYDHFSKIDMKIPTHDQGGHIDICFSNAAEVNAWIYESYFSDHKPICVVWPKPV